MKNTTKLKHLLQLYRILLDMDQEGNFHLTMTGKLNPSSHTYIDKAYTTVVGKAFACMVRELKRSR